MKQLIEESDIQARLRARGIRAAMIRTELEAQNAACAILPEVVKALRQQASDRAYREVLKQAPYLDKRQLQRECRRNAERAIEEQTVLASLVMFIRDGSPHSPGTETTASYLRASIP